MPEMSHLINCEVCGNPDCAANEDDGSILCDECWEKRKASKVNRYRKIAKDWGSVDGISPLLTTPDYGSNWSYTHLINNNIPASKRKRFKKKRKKDFTSNDQSMQKVAFTGPTGTYPAFTDFKSPLNQAISIIINNFNTTEKNFAKQQEYNDKIAKAIDKLEQEIKDLKKK